ncbi:putative aspergillopepsin [Truncatella angustata]|uniref:Aspergillopepsin n=1 Tax=Truncatella angustata TaxID=152316 RepID=A0A9P8ZVX2_9PEZI|nr:putative aspergillopepsin [Truncatella angustata]KAH6652440.1 putative aspergillopepsin [Truncatella angustata]
MKFTTVFTALTLAEAALGARFTEQRRERNAKRLAERGISRQTNPLIPVDNEVVEGLAIDNQTQVSYSSNWAGAVLIGTGYKAVTGTFVVPTPSAASAWVGIDGDTASNSILQTGVDFYVEGSQVSFDAWYEWYPDYAYTFSGITISAGDTITVTVTATSTTGGTAVVKNVSTGKSVTHTFTGQSQALQELNAEWIVEDFSSGGSLVPFADFGSVTFTNAYATTSSGTVGVSGAEIIDIKQSNKVLTDVTIDSSSEVTITYTG